MNDANDPSAKTDSGQVEQALTTLGYSPKWLEYGFLNEDYLMQQIAHYHAGDDRNTEHYRYAAFRTLLNSRSVMDDATIDRYVELAQSDPDPMMGGAALGDLLYWRGLTADQLERLERSPAYAAPSLQKIARCMRLLSELRSLSGDVDTETFDRCLASADSFVQRALLERRELSQKQLERLRKTGANRAIRNIAKAKLDPIKKNM